MASRTFDNTSDIEFVIDVTESEGTVFEAKLYYSETLKLVEAGFTKGTTGYVKDKVSHTYL
jgi:hypothetical protein